MSSRDSHTGPASRRGTAVDEAAEWLAALSDPACEEGERQEFLAWLRRSTLHVEEFLRISALAKRLSSPGLWPPESIQQLVEQARAKPDGLIRLAGPDIERERPRPWKRNGFRLAASIVLAAALGVLAFVPGRIPGDSSTYATATGEMRSIMLPDGSRVDLNTRSRLRLHYSPETRGVELLEGEAIFRVAKDRQRPFRVAARSTEIVAIGTMFNVYAQQARTVVTVLEGRVEVTDRPPAASAAHQQLVLARGDQAVIAPHQPISRVALADPAKVTSWTERRLIFEDTPLANVAAEFARYNSRVIRIEDGAIAARQITGVFDATDPASLVQFLAAQGDIQVTEQDGGWVLRENRSSGL